MSHSVARRNSSGGWASLTRPERRKNHDSGDDVPASRPRRVIASRPAAFCGTARLSS
ncbi:MAG: hypothetical protein U0797_04060 [Gemmataceae bacterium]